jgi:hypothetical protein
MTAIIRSKKERNKMAGKFFYRLSVHWNSGSSKAVIPIFAFKPGHSGWDKNVNDLDTLEQIASNANYRKSIVVCSFTAHCYRELENRTINYFELYVKNSLLPNNFAGEKPTVATLRCRDMNALRLIVVNQEDIKMSCQEFPKDSLSAVQMDFKGDLTFE